MTVLDTFRTEGGAKLPIERWRLSLERSITATRTERNPAYLRGHALCHLLGVHAIEGEIIMARGKTRKSAAETNGAPKFVDVRLSVEQRAEFVRWQYSDKELTTWLESFVNDGYRIGFSWASEQQAYFVSLTGRDTGGPNDGLCMTSFAGDIRTAMALAFYKHTVVTEMVWAKAGTGEAGAFG